MLINLFSIPFASARVRFGAGWGIKYFSTSRQVLYAAATSSDGWVQSSLSSLPGMMVRRGIAVGRAGERLNVQRGSDPMSHSD